MFGVVFMSCKENIKYPRKGEIFPINVSRENGMEQCLAQKNYNFLTFIWESRDIYRQSPIFSLVTKKIL